MVFVAIGWTALRASLEAGSPEGASGALASLADENGGKIMLVLIAIGLLCHGALSLVQASLDPEHHGDRDAKDVATPVFHALGQGWLLLAVAIGFMAYGMYQSAEAVYRRIEHAG